MRHVFYPTLTIAVLLSCLATAQAQSREEREVRALLDRAIAAGNSTDEKVLQQNLAEHSRAGGPFFPPFATALAGFPDVQAMVKQSLGQVTKRSYAPTGAITVRVDKNLAWATYPWRASISFKDGTQRSYEGRATITFVREGKAWKFAHWHSSLVAPAPLTVAARDAEAQRIIETERAAWEAIKNKQPPALADYFTEDASIFMDSSAYRMSGKTNLLGGLTAYIENTETRSYQMLEPQVQLLGDTALLTYYFTHTGTSSGKDFSTAGKISVVFVKQGGAWRALHEHLSVNR